MTTHDPSASAPMPAYAWRRICHPNERVANPAATQATDVQVTSPVEWKQRVQEYRALKNG